MQHTRFIYTYVKLACILACLAFMASSCNSDASSDLSMPKGGAMSFNVSDLSRASIATGIDKFAVFGDMKFPANDATSSPVVVFNKTEVVNKDGSWTYDGIQYWFPSHEHSFVAVSPVSVLADDAATAYSNSSLSFIYEIPAPGGNISSTGDVTDILISTHRRYYDSEETSDNQISLKFSHGMSLINIAPAFYDNSLSSDSYILIHSLKFSKVATKARFDISPAARQSNNQTDDRVIDVTGLESGDLTIGFSTPVKVQNDAQSVYLFADNDAVIMLPQDFADDSEANITLFYTINDDDTMKQLVLPLNKNKWTSGSSYTYKFTFERYSMKFDGCDITPWTLIKEDEIIVD